jgi:hypothetical protein
MVLANDFWNKIHKVKIWTLIFKTKLNRYASKLKLLESL